MATVSVRIEEIKHYECSEHGHLGVSCGGKCPYCDKCSHGKMATQVCNECNDFKWIDGPLTRKEFETILSYQNHNLGWRYSPYPRQYTTVSLLNILLNEYRKHKGW